MCGVRRAGCDNDCWRGILGYDAYPLYEVTDPNDMRLAAIVFDRRFYLQMYPDVAAAAQADGRHQKYSEWHWLNNGIREGRVAAPTFDSVFYMNTHPDVRAAFGWNNYEAAILHFVNSGRFEGRRASTFFDVTYYHNRYPDLQAAFGGNNAFLLDHFVRNGMMEGRQGSEEFAPAWYLGTNPDVQAATGSNWYRGGMQHYYQFGLNEGRPGAP